MESIDQTIDRIFPQSIDVRVDKQLDALATLKSQLKDALPRDSIVELTILLNTIQLGVWVPGENWRRRSATVNIT